MSSCRSVGQRLPGWHRRKAPAGRCLQAGGELPGAHLDHHDVGARVEQVCDLHLPPAAPVATRPATTSRPVRGVPAALAGDRGGRCRVKDRIKDHDHPPTVARPPRTRGRAPFAARRRPARAPGRAGWRRARRGGRRRPTPPPGPTARPLAGSPPRAAGAGGTAAASGSACDRDGCAPPPGHADHAHVPAPLHACPGREHRSSVRSQPCYALSTACVPELHVRLRGCGQGPPPECPGTTPDWVLGRNRRGSPSV